MTPVNINISGNYLILIITGTRLMSEVALIFFGCYFGYILEATYTS